MRPDGSLGIVVALTILAAAPAAAYLKYGTDVGTRTVVARWHQFPVRYFVRESGTAGVSAQQFQSAVSRAFGTWHAVSSATTSSQFAGFTQALPQPGDGANVLGFFNDPDPKLDRALAATRFLFDRVTGEIAEADILFKPDFTWSTAPAGEPNRYDVESIAVHEIGHLLGLSHSALGETELVAPAIRRMIAAEAVMFPIAFPAGNISERTLRADDIAGISDIYGTGAFQRQTGSISGRVTKNGAGVFGAHVVAFSPATGKLVGGFSLDRDGNFVIAGLDPGPHVLRAEPLDDGDVESFFSETADVDLDFRVKLHERVVVVPRGGGTRNIEIKVTPK
jgi:hypothetical protein